jgi:hypothetical protein
VTSSSVLRTAVAYLPIEPGATTSTPLSAETYLLTYSGLDRLTHSPANATAPADSLRSTARSQGDQRPDQSIEAIAALKPLMPSGAHFIQLGVWRGRVLETRASDFTATLLDQISQAPEEVGTFQMGELSDDDLSLVAPGAEFYWVVGYQVNAARQRTRTSVIRMRRLPSYSSEEAERAEHWADSKSHLFGQNGSGST